MNVGALIVDDEEDIRLLIRLTVDGANQGLHVKGEAEDGPQALEIIDELDPEVVILDQMMPQMSGLETAKQILSRRPEQKIVFCSAYLDARLRSQARELGITHCLSKDQIDKVPATLMEVVSG